MLSPISDGGGPNTLVIMTYMGRLDGDSPHRGPNDRAGTAW